LLWGDILRPRRDRWGIDSTHQVLIHHRTGSVAVPNILEIISRILAYIRFKWIVCYSISFATLVRHWLVDRVHEI
jgi:hypothetical protein